MTKKESKFLYLDIVAKIISDYKDEPYFTSLKSERELSDEYNVSRPTIRKAFEELERQEKILKIPGKGCVYIGREDYVQSAGKDTQISFFNNALMRGIYVSNKVLFQNVVEADYDISLRLDIKKNSQVFHLQRLRKLNGNTCSLENSYIPFKLCPELIQVDFGTTPLHNTLYNYGIKITHAKRIVEVVRANDYDAMHLGVEPGDPVAMIQTTCYAKDKIVEYVCAKVPAFKMRIEISTENKYSEERNIDKNMYK